MSCPNAYLTAKTDNSFEMINFDLNKVVLHGINCKLFDNREVKETDHVGQVGNFRRLIHLRHLHTIATISVKGKKKLNVLNE